jgi:hypothetical protein
VSFRNWSARVRRKDSTKGIFWIIPFMASVNFPPNVFCHQKNLPFPSTFNFDFGTIQVFSAPLLALPQPTPQNSVPGKRQISAQAKIAPK